MPTLFFYNQNRRQTEKIEVRFRKDERLSSRYNVVRADNGRMLGWLSAPTGHGEHGKLWSTHVTPSAFRGDDIDDEGDILDDVPKDLFGFGQHQFECPAICHTTTRREAAEELVSHLSRKQATALGFGRHYRVSLYPTVERREAAKQAEEARLAVPNR